MHVPTLPRGGAQLYLLWAYTTLTAIRFLSMAHILSEREFYEGHLLLRDFANSLAPLINTVALHEVKYA